MLNVKDLSAKVHNRYDLQLVDAQGNIKQEAYAENIVVDLFFKQKYYTNSSWMWSSTSPKYIHLGSGTTEPTSSDTELTQYLFEIEIESSTRTILNKEGDVRMISTAKVPAEASYTGDIAEIGLVGGGGLMSHALLKDAEGNPISIKKEDTDSLVITVTSFYAMRSSDSKFILFNGTSGIAWRSMSRENTWGRVDFLRLANICKIHDTDDNTISTYVPLATSTFASATYSGLTVTFAKTRIGAESANDIKFWNALCIDGLGFMYLPNPELFPEYELTEKTIGVGDGETTEFSHPIEMFIKDSEVITVDGAILNRGVDYVVDNYNNQSELANVSIGYFATIHSGAIGGGHYHPFNQSDTIGVHLKLDKPVIFKIDYNDPLIQNKVNKIKMGDFEYSEYTYTDRLADRSRYAGIIITIAYSNDLSNWTEVASFDLGEDNDIRILEQPITATYWKYTTTLTENASSTAADLLRRGEVVSYGSRGHFLGYVGGNIKFTTPPAPDATITFKCRLDRPYKSADYVIDFSGSLKWEK